MRKLCLSLALVLGTLSPALAQLSVEVRLEQDQFLAGEPIVAAVRITNRSGQTIRLGADEDWLGISVEGLDGKLLPRFADPPVVGEFELETSKIGTKRVNLTPYFPLTEPGRYAVTATVKVKEWGGADRASRPKSFNVIHGSSLWEQEFGVPKKEGDTNAAPEIRRYSLLKASYLKGQQRLYFRLADATGGRIFRVYPIGVFPSFSRPDVQIDQESNLHVLYLNEAHTCSYTVFSPDGALLVRQTHDYTTESRPSLKFGNDSKVIVSGGVRRVTASDYPAPPKEEVIPVDTGTNAVPAAEQAKSPTS